MNKNYIVKKIKDLPLFQGTPTGSELIAFQDPATGITYKIEQNKIGGSGGTTDHQGLTLDSRNATGAHPNLEAAIENVALASAAADQNLQIQIFEIVENSPIDIVRFFMTEQITLLGQTYNLSSETKGTVAATPITVSVTGTDRATSNRIARFIGDTPLAVARLIPAQNTQIFIRANKNNTNRLVYIYFDFYDYAADGTTILKGSTSDVLLTNTAEVYNLLLQVAEYTAQVGARSLVDCRTYQTGGGAAAQTTISIAGDYVSRFQYRLPAGSLSFLDEKLISTQDLPSLNLLSGATQKEVNAAQDTLNAGLKQFSLQVEISGRDRFTQLFGRACNITEVLKDADITNILVSKNGGADIDLLASLPYAVAKNDKLKFTLTYDQLTRVALTLNCSRL